MLRSNTAGAAIGFVLVAACGDRPAGPSPPMAPSPPLSVSRVRIEGPSTIAPGASAQYRAVALFADGRTQDVTTGASWTSCYVAPSTLCPGLVTAAGGMVTGGSPGEADLVVTYPDSGAPGTVSDRLRILVLEPGTFRVSGRVTDAGGPLQALVKVVAGTGAGQSTLAKESDGSYAVYGLAGAVTLGVSEESFQTETRTIVVHDHQTVDFSLQPLAGYNSVTGEWRLTLRAASSCGSEIPEDATTRTIQASLSQRGSRLTFTFSSPTIVRDAPYSPFGGVGPGALDFYLQRDPDQTPPGYVLLEMLEPGRFLGIAANARGVRTGNTVVGTLSGEFSLYRAMGTTYRAPGTTLERSCRRLTGSPVPTSETHTFRLDRN